MTSNPLDRLLRETLSGRAAIAPPTPCLDAETAAAMADDTLTADEQSAAESHVAACARCQALLAAMVRTTPPAPRAWWRQPVMMWMAPLAVATAAAVVWVNVSRRDAVAPAPAPAPVVQQTAQVDTLPRPGEPAAARPFVPAPPPAAAADRPDAAKTRPTPTSASALADTRNAPQSAGRAAPQADRGSAGAQIPSTPLPLAAPAAPLGADADSRVAAPENRAAPPPAPQQARAESAAGLRESTGILARRLSSVAEPIVVSSNQRSRWRIGRNGALDYSVDGGSTWQSQSTGVSVTLTAGSSPSPSVCWLVGPGGTVILTTDEGRSWQRLPAPAAVDLSSIRATDESAATIVAADGRTFTTVDRGRSWRDGR